MKGFYRVNDCCCGCSLRTGTLILSGCSVVIGSILLLLRILVGDIDKRFYPFLKLVLLFTCLLNFGIGICGVFVAITKRRGYLLPHLFLSTIQVVFILIGGLIGVLIMIIAIIGGGEEFDGYAAAAILLCIILLHIAGLLWYFTSVVHSYYEELGEQNAEHAILV